MNATRLLSQRTKILQKIEQLKPMRKGSVTQQYFPASGKSGSKTRRGPYPLYTCKKKGKTVSKRIRSELGSVYEQQIAQFRRFEELVAEFAEVGERLADLDAAESGEKKGSRR